MKDLYEVKQRDYIEGKSRVDFQNLQVILTNNQSKSQIDFLNSDTD